MIEMLINSALAQEKDVEIIRQINESLREFIPGGLNGILIWAIGIGGIIALGVFIWVGILRISSGGNMSKIGESNEWMKAAIFGLILLFVGFILLMSINPALLGR